MDAEAQAIKSRIGSGGDATDRGTRLIAAGGVVGALASSSCCIIPVALFLAGVGGAWLGNLTALAPYQPWIIAATVGVLALGYYRVYRRPKIACADGTACSNPLPDRIVKGTLWTATGLVLAAIAFNVAAPFLFAG